MVETTGCPLDEIDRYKVPTDLSLPGCLTQIQSIEDPIEPAVLGLNENAAILRNTNDSLDFLEGVLATQPQVEKHCTENSKYIFPEMKLRFLVPNFYIHVSGSDLYIFTIGLIWNLYFPALCERALSSTAGVERRAGNCRPAGLAAFPYPPLRFCG
jgi:hypothetical protein